MTHLERSGKPGSHRLISDTPVSPKSKKREILGWIISISAAVVIALGLRFFVFEFVRIDGPSMEPTLYTNEYVVMDKISYRFSPPARGDIVISSYPDHSHPLAKRIIGVAGDTLSIQDGVLYVNGEENSRYFTDIMNEDFDEITVPADTVFIMGDNRNVSKDSRSVGAVPVDKILGRAVFVIWPPAQMHGLQ